MKTLTVALIPIVAIALFACPATEKTPQDLIAETLAQGQEYIRKGEYAKVWTLYSHDFRKWISDNADRDRMTVQKELAKGSDWIEEWVLRQFGVTAAEFLKLTAREQDEHRNKVKRDAILTQRIVGKVLVEGEHATAKIQQDGSTGPARMSFVLQDGRWLFDMRDFMPVK